MSRRFKRPTSIDPKDRREERHLQLMAMHVMNQGMLDKLLEGAPPMMRAAMVERLRPFLPFTPDLGNTDCPDCRLPGGALTAHLCTPAGPILPLEHFSED